MTATTESDLTAAAVGWDLEPLVEGHGTDGADQLLDEADRLAGAVEARRGTIANLDAGELAAVMTDLGRIGELVGRAGSYAGLRFASTPPTRSTGPCCSASKSGRPRSPPAHVLRARMGGGVAKTGSMRCSPTSAWPSAATTSCRRSASARIC